MVPSRTLEAPKHITRQHTRQPFRRNAVAGWQANLSYRHAASCSGLGLAAMLSGTIGH
jgi:hypothetical protein